MLDRWRRGSHRWCSQDCGISCVTISLHVSILHYSYSTRQSCTTQYSTTHVNVYVNPALLIQHTSILRYSYSTCQSCTTQYSTCQSCTTQYSTCQSCTTHTARVNPALLNTARVNPALLNTAVLPHVSSTFFILRCSLRLLNLYG